MKFPVGESVSQLVARQLCSDAWAEELMLLCAVAVSVCDAGAAPPGAAVNDNDEALNVRGAAVPERTVRVTPKESEPTFEFTVTVLVYVPTARAARPAGAKAMVTVVGTVDLLREVVNQLGLPLERVTATPAGSPITCVYAAGTVPPI